jgi:hypothetical protein
MADRFARATTSEEVRFPDRIGRGKATKVLPGPMAGSLRTISRERRQLVRFLLNLRIADSDCWTWTGNSNGAGYGTFDKSMAHRWIYEFCYGPIPADLVIDHLCSNKRCVNPIHLEPVSSAENNRRARLNCPSSICRNGHPRTQENTHEWTTRRGVVTRYCRDCRSDNQRSAHGS